MTTAKVTKYLPLHIFNGKSSLIQLFTVARFTGKWKRLFNTQENSKQFPAIIWVVLSILTAVSCTMSCVWQKEHYYRLWWIALAEIFSIQQVFNHSHVDTRHSDPFLWALKILGPVFGVQNSVSQFLATGALLIISCTLGTINGSVAWVVQIWTTKDLLLLIQKRTACSGSIRERTGLGLVRLYKEMHGMLNYPLESL